MPIALVAAVANAEVSSGPSVTDWLGVAGTWVLGIAAAWIAYVQYRHSKFRPKQWAYCDPERRILVRIVNEGAGAGIVQDVNLFGPDHLESGEALYYEWELGGEASKDRPVPFTLAGGASAHLFLIPNPEVGLEGLLVRVDYATSDSGCLTLEQVDGRLYGTTYIDRVTDSNQ